MASGSNNYILSLKNIYQLLTKDDYPCPSSAVVKRSMKRGVTLLSFWRGILSSDLAITPAGNRLWVDEDKRPRYLSDIMNRSRPYPFYSDYFKAVAGIINPATLLNIIDRMARFLLSSDYSSRVLNIRLAAFVELLGRHDGDVTPAIQSFLTELLWQKSDFEGQSDRQVFFDAFFLSVMALHAFFGSKMNNEAMTSLRTEAAFIPLQLLSVYQKRNRGAAYPPPDCLTNMACELCREALPRDQFFGRKEETGYLKHQIIHGGKIILSGIGGIGKTELMRQVLRDILMEGIFSQVAYVQYQENLHESFIRAFLNISGSTMLMKYQECEEKLNRPAGGRTLLLIDNMNTPLEEDKTLSDLSSLRCDIVMTSRLASFSGFRLIPLSAPELNAALHIFSAQYGRDVSGASARALDTIISMKLNRHPLTCAILGKMARAKQMDIEALQAALEKYGLSGSYTEEAQTVRIEDTLQSLFGLSRLTLESQRLLRLFALLPLRLYSFRSCCELFQDISDDPDSLSGMLESLSYQGWLQSSTSSYSMHPVIAEAVLKGKPSLEDYPKLLSLLSYKIDPEKFRQWDYVHIAYFSLKNSASRGIDTLRLTIRTAFLLIERSITDAAQQLLDIAFETAKTSDSAIDLYDCVALQLNLLRNAGIFEGADQHVTDILRLYPLSEGSGMLVSGIGLALFFAYSLSMEGEREALYRMLAQGKWQGPDYVTQCHYMATTQEFTSNYRDGILWADRGLDYLAGQDGLGSLDAASLYKAKALFCALCGLPQDSEECVRHYKRIIGDWYDGIDFIELAQISQYLGIAYFQTGEYEKSLTCLFESLDAFRKTFPGDSIVTEHTLNNIGNACYRLKRYPEAILYNRKAFEMHLRLNKVPNIQLAALMNNLGCVLRDSGKQKEALDLFEEARNIVNSLGEREHLCLAEISLNLGLLYEQGGDSLQARPLFEAALPIFERNYGPEHIKTNMARGKLSTFSDPSNKLPPIQSIG